MQSWHISERSLICQLCISIYLESQYVGARNYRAGSFSRHITEDQNGSEMEKNIPIHFVEILFVEMIYNMTEANLWMEYLT